MGDTQYWYVLLQDFGIFCFHPSRKFTLTHECNFLDDMFSNDSRLKYAHIPIWSPIARDRALV